MLSDLLKLCVRVCACRPRDLQMAGRLRRFNSSRTPDRTPDRPAGKLLSLPGLEELRKARVAGQVRLVLQGR